MIVAIALGTLVSHYQHFFFALDAGMKMCQYSRHCLPVSPGALRLALANSLMDIPAALALRVNSPGRVILNDMVNTPLPLYHPA